MKWYERILRKSQIKKYETFYIEDEEEITDEIEKSLWIIKEALDLPTEEIQISVDSRKRSKKCNK
tara:strand:+ start:321 stop:515 length:195 start_codon:yes stop_codon:yes gene_type:complete